MGNVAKLRIADNVEAAGDPLRAQLANAITEAEKARQSVAKVKAAIDRLFKEAVAADKAIETAKAGVERAKLADASAIAAAAADGVPAASGTVASARAAVVDAEDKRDALKAARRKLEEDLPGWESEAIKAKVEVERLISEILKPEAERLMETARVIAGHLAPVRAALLQLINEPSPRTANIFESLAFQEGRKPLEETRAQISELLRDLNTIPTAPDSWAEARARLRTDPHAALPEIDRLLDADGHD